MALRRFTASVFLRWGETRATSNSSPLGVEWKTGKGA
jgi:hypothetical protein